MTAKIEHSNGIQKPLKEFESYRVDFLTRLLKGLEQGQTRKELCNTLNLKNNALQYHINRLLKEGLIEQTQRQPYATYKITEKGIGIQKIIVHSDGHIPKPLYKCHNQILGWRIENFGIWRFNEKIWKEMKGNWHFQKLHINGHNINIHDTGLIKIYCPPMFHSSPRTAFGHQIDSAGKIAYKLANRYGMKIKPMHIIREGEKSNALTRQLASKIGRIKLDQIWTDASPPDKELEIEESQFSDQFEKLLALPDLFEAKMIPAIEKLTEQIELHLAVQKKTGETMDHIKVGINELRDAIKELKR